MHVFSLRLLIYNKILGSRELAIFSVAMIHTVTQITTAYILHSYLACISAFFIDIDHRTDNTSFLIPLVPLVVELKIITHVPVDAST